ncbi:MAG: pyridoxal phosphate-dependent aminotransferase [Acidobacteriota bacterium]|jgi:aspartate aminotransferase
MRLSKRAESIQASPIRKLAPLAVRAKARGISIYHLNIGQPDIPTPEAYLKAVQRYGGPVLSYGPSDGLPELKKAVSTYFAANSIEIAPEELIITTGGSEAALFALNLVGDPGDEVIVPEPFYTNYNGFATLAGMKVVPVTTRAEDGFHLPPMEDIEKKVTSRTRAILVCSPNNPTGTILAREELEGLARIALQHGLFLIGDEVYKEFTYDGGHHTSLLELPEVRENAIVVDSISKRFSACGARIGALISRNEDVIDMAMKFAQARLCPPTIEQLGAAEAYKLGRDYFDGVRTEYQQRRDALLEGLSAHSGIYVKKPAGAFYMVLRLPVDDTESFARWMLDEFEVDGETVMVAPAAGFYATPGLGMNEVRVAYVLQIPRLKKAANILVEGVRAYNRSRGRSVAAGS